MLWTGGSQRHLERKTGRNLRPKLFQEDVQNRHDKHNKYYGKTSRQHDEFDININKPILYFIILTIISVLGGLMCN